MSMDEPLTPIGEITAAAHELFLGYQAAGFDVDQALFLTGCVVSSVGARITGQVADVEDHQESMTYWRGAISGIPNTAMGSPAVGGVHAEWLRRTGGSTSPNVGKFCDDHQLPWIETIHPDGQRTASCPACDLRGAIAEAKERAGEFDDLGDEPG